jgi:hypothetical protein
MSNFYNINKNKNNLEKIIFNDCFAFQKNTSNNWVYNKLHICKLQNIICNVMPIYPEHFPVIIKPIYNLYGMSKDTYKINDLECFKMYWGHSGFWSTYLNGTHLSIDFVLIDNKIVFSLIFQGHYLENIIGAFDYWETKFIDIPINLKNNINKIINKLNNYTGLINVECIGDYVIECHLRGGDIFYIDDDINKEIYNLYTNYEWNFNKTLDNFFIVPIWKQKMKNPDTNIEKLTKNIICEIDGDGLSGPPLFKRKALLFGNNLDKLINCRNNIYKSNFNS